MDVSTEAALAIVLLVAVQVGLALFALVDLWRRERVAGGRKLVWAVVILVGGLAGSVIYLFVGRAVPPLVDDVAGAPAADPVSEQQRIRSGVDALYGPEDR